MKKSQFTQTEQGFTFIEVLVGMMLMLTFTLIALEGLVISTVMRVKAQRQSSATNWIQRGIEDIKFLGSTVTGGTCGSYGNNLLTTVNNLIPVTAQIKLEPGQQNYNLTRTLNPEGNTLKVTYQVTNPEGGNVIAQLYTEVIPDDAFTSCP
jgi:prepilin-type N-terminal cleavage/methylation domain-containing protein